jgi:Heterokaryon incompatibility protein (HET)
MPSVSSFSNLPQLTPSLDIVIITSTLSQYEDDIIDYYITLSYVWRNENNTRRIHIDFKQLAITASLESVLRHIRGTRRTVKIWAETRHSCGTRKLGTKKEKWRAKYS